MVRVFVLFLVLGVSSVLAQNPSIRPASIGKGQSLEMRKMLVSNQVRSSSAIVQFAALKLTIAELLGEIEAARDGDSDDDAALRRHAEDEILRGIAMQLETFINMFEGTPQAEAARAILARVFVRLDRVGDAARVLKEFDPTVAAYSDVLHAALAVSEISEIASHAPDWLNQVAARRGPVEEKFDAVFVAIRLGNFPLASRLMGVIRERAESFEDRAAFLLALAEFTERLGRVHFIPVERLEPAPAFVVDLSASAALSPNQSPVGQNFETKPAPAAGRVSEPIPASPDRFRETPMFKAIAKDAEPGLAAIRLRARVGELPDFMPANTDFTFREFPNTRPIQDVVTGLLFRVVHEFAGTPAARIAGARLTASRLEDGSAPIRFQAVTIDGEPVSIDDFVGEVLLLDFFATWDAESMAERERLAALYRAYRASGFQVISISLDSPADEWLVRAVAENHDMDWPIIVDGSHSPIARSYAVDALPHRVLINRAGRISEARPERLTLERLDQMIIDDLRDPVLPDMRRHDDAAPRRLDIGTQPYAGPRLTAGVEVQESVPPSYTLRASVWIAADDQFRHDRTEQEGPTTRVFFTLTTVPKPVALDGPVDATPDRMLDPRVVRFAIGESPGATVQVFVKHVIAGVQYIQEPLYLLAARLDVPDDNRNNYVGPPVNARLARSNEQPPRYILWLDPVGGYTWRRDSIRREETVTQVLASLLPLGGGGSRFEEPEALRVTLGEDVATQIEVLVNLQRDPNQPASHALATSLQRF